MRKSNRLLRSYLGHSFDEQQVDPVVIHGHGFEGLFSRQYVFLVHWVVFSNRATVLALPTASAILSKSTLLCQRRKQASGMSARAFSITPPGSTGISSFRVNSQKHGYATPSQLRQNNCHSFSRGLRPIDTAPPALGADSRLCFLIRFRRHRK